MQKVPSSSLGGFIYFIFLLQDCQMFKYIFKAPHDVMVLWCSGYHICITCRRSPVRSWTRSSFMKIISEFASWKANSQSPLYMDPWYSGYHICLTCRRSPVRAWADSYVLFSYILLLISLVRLGYNISKTFKIYLNVFKIYFWFIYFLIHILRVTF